MKCLEKDRTRRYETANGLAADLKRHLDNEPVAARPPSAIYRLQKSVRRNKAAFAAAGGLAFVLMLGSGLSTWEAVRATHAEYTQSVLRLQADAARARAEANQDNARTQAARSAQVSRFLKEMLNGVGLSAALGRDPGLLKEILYRTSERLDKELTNQPLVVAELQNTIHDVYRELDRYKPVKTFPARDPKAQPEQVDLTPYYTTALDENWQGSQNSYRNDLATLGNGLRTYQGVRFDVRGIVQLAGTVSEQVASEFPQAVTNIYVGLKCKRIHFLHATGWGRRMTGNGDLLYEPFGTRLASYRIHYSSGTEIEVPVIHGKDVSDWWYWPGTTEGLPGLRVAWTGTNASSQAQGTTIRLFDSAWENPQPDMEVRSIDFVSAMTKSAPFLIAITAEP
jgi:hypothetical protein